MKNNVVTDCFYKNRFTKKFFDFNNDINQVQKFKKTGEPFDLTEIINA